MKFFFFLSQFPRIAQVYTRLSFSFPKKAGQCACRHNNCLNRTGLEPVSATKLYYVIYFSLYIRNTVFFAISGVTSSSGINLSGAPLSSSSSIFRKKDVFLKYG